MLDWPGKVASTIFLGRCNFRCPFCHNAELVVSHESMPDLGEADVLSFLADRRDWVDHVVITGGEPTLAARLPAFLRALKAQGFRVKLDTNGSRPGVLERLVAESLVDFVAMDVKTYFDDYPRVVRVPVDVEAVRASAHFLAGGGVEHEFRMTVVPGLHDARTVARAARELAGLGATELVLQRFRPENVIDPAFLGVGAFDEREAEEVRMAASAHLKTYWRGA